MKTKSEGKQETSSIVIIEPIIDNDTFFAFQIGGIESNRINRIGIYIQTAVSVVSITSMKMFHTLKWNMKQKSFDFEPEM